MLWSTTCMIVCIITVMYPYPLWGNMLPGVYPPYPPPSHLPHETLATIQCCNNVIIANHSHCMVKVKREHTWIPHCWNSFQPWHSGWDLLHWDQELESVLNFGQLVGNISCVLQIFTIIITSRISCSNTIIILATHPLPRSTTCQIPLPSSHCPKWLPVLIMY